MAKDAITKVVAIGGSAGSLDVILQLLPLLPATAGVCYIIVMHRKNDADSVLTSILSTRTTMPVHEVEDKEAIRANCIYVVPPDYHLLIENEKMFSLDSSEKVHFSRPSIDVTFESVAEVFGEKTIGLLLSGANADGAKGLKRIKEAGGLAVVQEPSSAEVEYMPRQAIRLNVVDRVLKTEEMGPVLNELLKET